MSQAGKLSYVCRITPLVNGTVAFQPPPSRSQSALHYAQYTASICTAGNGEWYYGGVLCVQPLSRLLIHEHIQSSLKDAVDTMTDAMKELVTITQTMQELKQAVASLSQSVRLSHVCVSIADS